MFGSDRIRNMIRGAELGLAAGGLLGLAFLFHNIRFIDSIPAYVILTLAAPVCAGALIGYFIFRFRQKKLSVWPGVIALLLAASPVLISRLAPDRKDGNPWRPKLVVIVIDGAGWNVIGPMIARGELKNIASLVKDGASGVLMSEKPMSSPALWTTLATGMPRDKHGVFSFYNTALDCKTERFWEITAKENKWSFGNYRWMTTWPPEGKGLFEIPDWTARNFATRPEKYSFIQRFLNTGVEGTDLGPFEELSLGLEMTAMGMKISRLDRLALMDLKGLAGRKPADKDRFLRNSELRGELHGVIARRLFDKYRPDVGLFAMYEVDEVGHLFWKDEPNNTGGNEVEEMYRLADESIGRILNGLDGRTTVAVVSDHGFESLSGSNYYDVPFLDAIISKMGLEKSIKGVSIGKRGYLFCAPGVEGGECDKALGEALVKLGKFTMNGEAMFETKVVGGGLDMAVPLGLGNRDMEKSECSFDGGNFPCNEITSSVDISGEHNIEGIILLKGPGIKRGWKIEGASIYDLTPTLLYLAGLPVGEDMPGRILDSAIEPARMSGHPASYIPGYPPVQRTANGGENIGDEEALKKRLKALGYIQ